MADTTKTRINEIDLLRFVAALLVLFFHYSFRGYAAEAKTVMPYPLLAPVFKYGYLGVDLFFIISGFVILMTASSGSFRRFVVSRIVRLYPAFWACCTITFAAILTIGGTRYSASIGQYLVNLTMLNGFFGVPYIDGAYWSLLVELRFYVLIAIVLLLGQIQRIQALLICWIAASIALEFLPLEWPGYLLIVDYSAYFIAGAICFLIWSQGISATRIVVLSACWGLALLQSIDRAQDSADYFQTPFSNAVVIAIVSAFFAVMLLVALRWTGFFGRRQWLVAGALTYPLYLLHQNIGFMIFNLTYPAINPHVIFWGATLIMLALAYVVHVQIEQRFGPVLKLALNRLFDTIARQPGRPDAGADLHR